MREDRELLELAAKAAGYEVLDGFVGFTVRKKEVDLWPYAWNPLVDDGDALRLAAKLRMDIEHGSPLDNSRYVLVSRCGIEMVRNAIRVIEEFEDESGRGDATRIAIVRAAAAMAPNPIPTGGTAP